MGKIYIKTRPYRTGTCPKDIVRRALERVAACLRYGRQATFLSVGRQVGCVITKGF